MNANSTILFLQFSILCFIVLTECEERSPQVELNKYLATLRILVDKDKRVFETFCGGVFLSPTKLLTAAHCLAPVRLIKNSVQHYFAVQQTLASAALQQRRQPVPEHDELFQVLKPTTVLYPAHFAYPAFDVGLAFFKTPPRLINVVERVFGPGDAYSLEQCYTVGSNVSKNISESTFMTIPVNMMTARECRARLSGHAHTSRHASHFLCGHHYSHAAVRDFSPREDYTLGSPLLCASAARREREHSFGLAGVLVGRVGPLLYFQKVSDFHQWIQGSAEKTVLETL